MTIRLDLDTIRHFKQLAEETGIPYQALISMYLRECASNQKKPSQTWRPPAIDQKAA